MQALLNDVEHTSRHRKPRQEAPRPVASPHRMVSCLGTRSARPPGSGSSPHELFPSAAARAPQNHKFPAHPLMNYFIPGRALRRAPSPGASPHEICSSPARRSARAPGPGESLHEMFSFPATRFAKAPGLGAPFMRCFIPGHALRRSTGSRRAPS